MFGLLTSKLQNLFSFFKEDQLTDKNVEKASEAVRLALLEADVNYEVALRFVEKIKTKALGEKITRGLKPGEQFIKIVYDELVLLMGEQEQVLALNSTPSVVLLCGLQGSGKTTTAVKLAYFLKKQGKKVLLCAGDLQRPGAVDQLEKLAAPYQLEVFAKREEKQPLAVAKEAFLKARKEAFELLIVDTAGRLHIDETLMLELSALKDFLKPDEVLFVASAALGQDAVKTAREFDQKIGLTGSVLTMLDGSARAGAAISIFEVTQKPLKFEGVGERVEDLQLFNPRSMADRILGMGDVINLAKKAEEHIRQEEKENLEKRLRRAEITYEDYLKQMNLMRRMGPLSSLMRMMPGFAGLGEMAGSEKELKKVEAMVLSMTITERLEKTDLSYSRRKRIALGSGTSVDDVNRLVKSFKKIKQLLKNMPKGDLSKMQQFLGGDVWR
ncbi:MAG: signal recognition particle protein [Parachlamydiales bacterium]|jgi:signal recognition particle subunit SRP54